MGMYTHIRKPSNSINRVTLQGHAITRPYVHVHDDGRPCCIFCLSFPQDNHTTSPFWWVGTILCKVEGKYALTISKYLRIYDECMVSGSLHRQMIWSRREGLRRPFTSLVVSQFEWLGRNKKERALPPELEVWPYEYDADDIPHVDDIISGAVSVLADPQP